MLIKCWAPLLQTPSQSSFSSAVSASPCQAASAETRTLSLHLWEGFISSHSPVAGFPSIFLLLPREPVQFIGSVETWCFSLSLSGIHQSSLTDFLWLHTTSYRCSQWPGCHSTPLSFCVCGLPYYTTHQDSLSLPFQSLLIVYCTSLRENKLYSHTLLLTPFCTDSTSSSKIACPCLPCA